MSPIEKLPAAASAEYSPSEWPGDVGGVRGDRYPLRLERPQRREAHRHQRRLGVARARQRILRPLEDDRGELLAERLVDLVEDRARRRNRVGQRLAHADGLAPLAGEKKCGRHRSFRVSLRGDHTAGARSVKPEFSNRAPTRRRGASSSSRRPA